MIFKQYYLDSLSQASYLIGDEESRQAAVVDPQRDIAEYVRDLEKLGLRLRYVVLTHVHADFVAGHIELQQRTGAEICLGAKAQAGYPFRPLSHGYEIEFGAVRLQILETPGHTPESISILVFDRRQPEKSPYAVLTGDTLFVGDVGRPDVAVEPGEDARTMAGQLYDSLRDRLLVLPPSTLVYPGHGSGSLCGTKLGPRMWSTIGEEQSQNYALQPMSREAFVEVMTMEQLEIPPYFVYNAYLNRRDRPTLEQVLRKARRALDVDELVQLKSAGAQLLDVRHPDEFALRHVCGSVNIGLAGRFETWAGTILDRDNPIVIVGEPGQEEEALIRLGRIGYDHVAGYLKDGLEALSATPELLRPTKRMDVLQLNEQMAAPGYPFILDVRSVQEWRQRRIDDSRHIPLSQLKDRLQDIPRDCPVVVHCSSGYRSSIAVSLLERYGFDNVLDLRGGLEAWEEQVVIPLLQSSESLQQAGGR